LLTRVNLKVPGFVAHLIYRAAIHSLDQPMSDLTVGVGWRRTSRTVAAVCLASCSLVSRSSASLSSRFYSR